MSVAIALAALAVTSVAEADSAGDVADPFALLFGEGASLDAGVTERSGGDDLALVSLHLGPYILLETLEAYHTQEGLCVQPAPVFDALEAAIEVTETGIEGWFLRPSNTLSIDFERRAVARSDIPLHGYGDHISQTPFGTCLTLELLSKLLPIDFTYEASVLRVQIAPRETLPLEASLERQALRRAIRPERVRPDYAEFDDPYRWITWPTIDLTTSLEAGAGRPITSQALLEIAGDLAKMTGQARIGASGDVIWTLSRASDAPIAFGPMDLHAVRIGHVAAPSLPMLSQGEPALGFSLTSRPIFASDVFDRKDIRGPLPQGWEAELYNREQLVQFVTEPDAAGDYIFRDVPLYPGLNKYIVRLYGPYGEEEERPVTIMVGQDLKPENEFDYTVGVFLEPVSPQDAQTATVSAVSSADISMFEASADGAANTPKTNRHVVAYGLLRYGLPGHISTQIAGRYEAERDRLSTVASVAGGYGATYGLARVAATTAGRFGAELSLQHRFQASGDRLELHVQDFGGLENTLTGFGPGRLQRIAYLAHDTQISLRRGTPLPLQTRLTWRQTSSDASLVHASARLAGRLQRTRWTARTDFSRLKSGSQSATNRVEGEVLAARVVRDVRVRASLSYAAWPRVQARNIDITAQRRFGTDRFGQVSLTQDLSAGETRLSAGLSHKLNHCRLSARASVSSGGDARLGLSLSVALFRDSAKRAYAFADPGLSRSGAIRARVFDDRDDDGIFGSDDTPLSDAGFIVGGTLYKTQTGDDGHALLAGLEPGRRIDLELKTASLEDPYLRPTKRGVAVRIRPGRVLEVPYPVMASGEIEGRLVLRRGGQTVPVANTPLQAIDALGQIIATTTSEYDGYFYFGDVPAQALTVRVAKSALDAVEMVSTPVAVALSRDVPFVDGVTIVITSADLKSIGSGDSAAQS
ncbi:MAG: hypothetical protein AAGF20_06120 [Pseudomonadota bacterium]